MKKLSFISVIVAAMLWGTSGLFVHYLSLYGFSALQVTAIRSTVAALSICIYALLTNKHLFKIKPKMLLLLAASGLSFYGAAACYYASMKMTSVSTAAVLMYTAPVMVMVYSVIFLGEKMSKLKGAAVVLMLVGCCLVSGIVGGLTLNPLGTALALLAAVCYAAYTILSKVEMNAGCHPLTATIYSAIFMALCALIVANPVDIVKTGMANPLPVILLGVGLGLCTFVIPSALFNLAMKRIPAGITSALSIIEPMSATVFGILFLDQVPDIFSFIGIAVIMLSVVFLALEDGDKKEKTKDEEITSARA